MEPVSIQHFLGEALCTSREEVQAAFRQSVDGVNEFLIAQKDTPYPYLVMLVCGPYDYVISRPLVERIALEFAETGQVPEDVAWEEL